MPKRKKEKQHTSSFNSNDEAQTSTSGSNDSEPLNDSKKMIAEELSGALDRKIKAVKPNLECQIQAHLKHEDDGIFLFSSSRKRTGAKDIQEEPPKRRTKPNLRIKRHIDGSESEDEEVKVRSVAVSAEWVMKNN